MRKYVSTISLNHYGESLDRMDPVIAAMVDLVSGNPEEDLTPYVARNLLHLLSMYRRVRKHYALHEEMATCIGSDRYRLRRERFDNSYEYPGLEHDVQAPKQFHILALFCAAVTSDKVQDFPHGNVWKSYMVEAVREKVL